LSSKLVSFSTAKFDYRKGINISTFTL